MFSPVERLTAALADRYRIERELGAGGMATVYLAHDLKHDRPVAIKVLRPELAAALGADRFLREIAVAAQLTHPHILPLHDSGNASGLLYYVMPYVAGESLRDRLAREGELPVAEAVRVARAVATALGAAHRRGIVHRDIKPENILLADGEPVVADFGIARAITESASDRLTSTGLAVGTPAYMSPEQASAEPRLDGRTDLYSLGAVLYEMLAGEPPFRGRTAEAITARKLTEAPPVLRSVRPAVPEALEQVVQKALARTPADRFQMAEEFIGALDQAISGATPAEVWRTVPFRQLWMRWLPWGIASALGITAVLALLRTPGPSSDADSQRLSILTPPGTQLVVNYGGAAVSPDGATVVFAAGSADSFRLYARRLDDWTVHPLLGTEGGMEPFFAPDGQAVGFLSTNDHRLKWVPLSGGVPRDICAAPLYTSASWADNDTVYFTDGGVSATIWKVRYTGGTVLTVSRTRDAAFIRVLPGSRYALTGDAVLVDLRSGQQRVILRGATWPRWVEPGFVVFAPPNTAELAAVAVDASTGRVTGRPVTIATGVSDGKFWGGASMWDVSINGTLVFTPLEGELMRGTFRIVDREGKRLAMPDAGPGDLISPRFSPNGMMLAFHRRQGASDNIWTLDLRNGVSTRVTSGERTAWAPLWSPDGSSVLFSLQQDSTSFAVVRQPLGGGPPERITEVGQAQDWPQTWASGGRDLVYSRARIGEFVQESGEFGVISLADRTARPITSARKTRMTPAVSPDGRWLAYSGDEAEAMQVFVRRYPDGPDVRVSRDGGIEPLWSPDSRELLFRSRSGEQVFGVLISGLERPVAGEPRLLFSGPYPVTGLSFQSRQWDITPDGRRFVIREMDVLHTRNAAAMVTGSELRVVRNILAIVRDSLRARPR